MDFSKVVKMQNRFVAREIEFYEGKRKLLSATVDTIDGLDPSNPAFTPPADARISGGQQVGISAGVAVGMLTNKQAPIYPEDAKNAHVSGTVVLQAVIGKDGGVHDLRVISAPWPSLAAAAINAVSQWQYKRYLLNGDPVEVMTTVNVVFTLGR